MEPPNKTRYWSNAVLFCMIAGLLLYDLKLGTPHAVYLWDESIYANNSLEMERSGNYLVYTVDGVVDHHNSKPPLVLWLQALSYKVFGYNEFALRFPTYLALLATLGLTLEYSRRLTHSLRAGLVACLVMLITHGLIRPHVFLSGDLDGVLVFFCTGIFLHHLDVIRRATIAARDIYGYLPFFVLGFLTKSTAIFLIIPPLLLSFMVSGNLKYLLKSRAVYFSILLFILFAAAYYSIRELYDPGYWSVVWYSEFTRVAVNIQPWLVYPWNSYFLFLRDDFFRYPLILLTITGPLSLMLPAVAHKKLLLHSLLIPFAYLCVITIPPVKLVWYDAPVYPLLAFGLGLATSGVFQFLGRNVQNHYIKELTWTAIILGLTCTAFAPFRHQLKADVYNYLEPEESAFALREFAAKHDLKRVRVIEEVRKARFIHGIDGLRFYQKALRINSGAEVVISSYIGDIGPHETVIVCRQKEKDSLYQRSGIRVLDSCRVCELIKIP